MSPSRNLDMEPEIPHRANNLIEYGFFGMMLGFLVVGVIPGVGKAIVASLLALCVMFLLADWLKKHSRDPAATVVKPYWTAFGLYLLAVSTYPLSVILMATLAGIATVLVVVYTVRVFQQRAHYSVFALMGAGMPLFFPVAFLFL